MVSCKRMNENRYLTSRHVPPTNLSKNVLRDTELLADTPCCQHWYGQGTWCPKLLKIHVSPSAISCFKKPQTKANLVSREILQIRIIVNKNSLPLEKIKMGIILWVTNMFHLSTVQKSPSEAHNSYVKNLFEIIVNSLDKKLVEFYISWKIDSLNQVYRKVRESSRFLMNIFKLV